MAPQAYKNTYLFQMFVLNMIIFILLVGYSWASLYPHITEIESQKSQLHDVVAKINKTSKEGISYDDFNSMQGLISEENSYILTLIRNVDQKFYERNIKNSGAQSYDTFITNLTTQVEEQKKSNVSQEREKLVETLIPKYSLENLNLGDELSDFKFVNYVESLLYAFNLTTEDAIGISDIKALEDYSVTVKGEETKKIEGVDSNIFYIPLSLKVEGKKEDVIDFLIFSENIANISIQEGSLQVYKDNKILRRIITSKSDNIYQNQLFDIERITIPEYIDSSISQSTGDFIAYLKENQGREKMQVELQLNFYVKGLPNYKIKESIKNTIKKYEELSKKVKVKSNEIDKLDVESSDVLLFKSYIKSIQFDLGDIQKTVTGLNAQMSKPQNLDEAYKTALKLNKKFADMELIVDNVDTKLKAINTPNK